MRVWRITHAAHVKNRSWYPNLVCPFEALHETREEPIPTHPEPNDIR